jgi:hypothetical protein
MPTSSHRPSLERALAGRFVTSGATQREKEEVKKRGALSDAVDRDWRSGADSVGGEGGGGEGGRGGVTRAV